MRKCKRCGVEYSEQPALSRKDNKTLICPRCGMIEALEEANRHRCIFENRYCRYANNVDNCFDCTAPDDESMTCR